jgi:xanthine dehydrogenase molybdenum-binding subunit
MAREETFGCTRVRHAIRYHITTHVRPDGTFVAGRLEAFSNQGAYASHGHGIVAKGAGAYRQLYRYRGACKGDAYTIYTNTAASGAMRAYGIPQITFALESHVDDIAKALNMDPVALRKKN